MIVPVYDISILPCFTYPMTNTIEKPKRYLGRKAITGEKKAVLEIMAKDDAEMYALYNFWKDDCNYGLEPFLLPVPFMGENLVTDTPSTLAQFKGELTSKKEKGFWKITTNLKIIGGVQYVIDDQGNYVFSDAGEFVLADGVFVSTANLSSFKGVTYVS